MANQARRSLCGIRFKQLTVSLDAHFFLVDPKHHQTLHSVACASFAKFAMASDDWSLTPATLARVAATETFEPTLDLDADAERALESHPELSLGIDCCGVCAKPEASMGDAAVECSTCRAVVYCGAKCEAADAHAHARSCALLSFAADLSDVARADARHRASAAAAVEATVDNLKLLGEETARKLIGPRGYRRGEEDDEDGKDEASRDAVKLRWGALFKLAKGSSEGPSGDTKDENENGDVSEKERAAALRALGDSLSFPLSIVAASWMFPIVYYTLSIGGGVGKHARDDYDETGPGGNAEAAEAKPAQIHLLGAAAAAAAAAPLGAQWWPWLVGFGCKLPPTPGLEMVAVGKGVKTQSSSSSKTQSFSKSSSTSFRDASYEAHVASAKKNDARSPYLIFAGDLMREADAEAIVAAARLSPAPIVTSARTEMELALESELMRDAGYELVGVEKNPFASPVPEQSPAMANDAQRANEWLAVYVPARSSGAPREPEARADGRKREGDGGERVAAKRRK